MLIMYIYKCSCVPQVNLLLTCWKCVAFYLHLDALLSDKVIEKKIPKYKRKRKQGLHLKHTVRTDQQECWETVTHRRGIPWERLWKKEAHRCHTFLRWSHRPAETTSWRPHLYIHHYYSNSVTSFHFLSLQEK